MRYRIIYPLFCFFAVSCAPPVNYSNQKFIPQRELTAVDFAEEGLSLMQRSRYFDAAQYFYRALELYPNVTTLRLNLAIALRELGDTSESRRILEKIVKDFPHIIQARMALVSILVKEGDHIRAQDLLLDTIESQINADDIASAAQVALAAVEFSQESGLEEASLCYALLAHNIQKSPQSKLEVAKVYLRQSDYQNLLDKFGSDLAKEAGPVQIELKLVQAIALIGLGDLEKALKELERLKLIVKKQPELLPEVTALYLASRILEISNSENIPLESAIETLDEDDQKDFNSIFSSQANASENALNWPKEIRDVFELQQPLIEE